MTDGDITEGDVSVLATGPGTARITEADVSVLATVPTNALITEADVSVLGYRPTGARVIESDVSALVYRNACYARRCQLLKIKRRDGVVKAFTTLDRDVEWLGVTYSACASLNPTASESASEIGQSGNIEITGIFSEDGIAEDELTAGLYDDAYLEVWQVSWDETVDDPQTPYRVQAGWLGPVTQHEGDFKAEILGPGARLDQTPITDVVTPGCKWGFGLADSRCGVDDDALAISASITGSLGRGRLFTSAISDPGGSVIWPGGRVRWTSGRNTGAECEVESVDFATQTITLWKIAPFVPEPGDTFDLLPGCPKTTVACKGYGNYDNFGGEEDVPGEDAIRTTVASGSEN